MTHLARATTNLRPFFKSAATLTRVEPDTRQPVVLLVDDDTLARRVTAEGLTTEGVTVLEADGAAAALEILDSRSVDAVVVDQHMPAGTGLDLTVLIRASSERRLLPIIFLSADDRPETRLAALKAGATDFMTKPIDTDEAAARVISQIRLARSWSEKVADLETRAQTVARLASIAPHLDAMAAADLMCTYISRAHGHRVCSMLAWEGRDHALVPVGSAGGRLAVHPDDPSLSARALSESGAWLQPVAPFGVGISSAACATLRRAGSPVGILAIEAQGGDQSELLAAVLDYASTASLHLGAALDGMRHTGRQRDSVREVLAGGGFQPAFQPIVDLQDRRVIGREALTRLDSGKPILDFLSEADAAGVRAECELALVQKALERSAEFEDGWVSVNVSPSVIAQHPEPLAEIIGAHPTPVVIELTENEPIDDYEVMREALSRIGPNVRVSVDDAGSGYASLRHVVDLRPQFMKLDRSWINGIETDQVRKALVAGIVAFCDQSQTALIAEGIETEAELEVLEDLGVRYGQGYLLGRPEPLRSPVSN